MRLLQTPNGQALIELAVFGTFFLMLLGVLLSYGLKYNFQQKAQMTAFRRALKIASDQERGVGSAMVMEDRSIPDPSTLFGVGSTAPIAAVASVQRDYKMDEQPQDADSLSRSVMDIQTSRDGSANTQAWMRRIYKTAAFRVERSVPEVNLDKYEQVYGSILALNTGFTPTDTDPNTWVSTSSSGAAMECPSGYYDMPASEDGTAGALNVCDSGESFTAIRIIDACSGEIADYTTCYVQAQQLVDPAFCERKCELAKVPGSTTNCNTVCNHTTNPPHQDPFSLYAGVPMHSAYMYYPDMGGAWYAAEWEAPTATNPNYNFPYLSGYRANGTTVPALFSFSGAHSPSDPAKQMAMGLQSDMTQNTARSESIDRIETTSAITTQEESVWTDTLNRTLVHQSNNIDANGFEINESQPGDFVKVTTDNVASDVSGSLSQTQGVAK